MNSFKLQSYNFKIKKTNSLGKITFRFCLRMVIKTPTFVGTYALVCPQHQKDTDELGT